MPNIPPLLKLCSLLCVVSLAAGCTSSVPPKPAPVSYQTNFTPTDEYAVLILRSTGAPMPVAYSLTSKEHGEVQVGKVYDGATGDELLLPWIAKFSKKMNSGLLKAVPSRETVLDVGTLYGVHGKSEWSNASGGKGSCGPVYSTFTPEPHKRYLALFTFFNGYCKQEIFDVTNGAPVLLKRES
ncbi:hypothetical protein [Pseudomonas oryzihabitans]|uniref:hypothetical protein n=1 Tax=Pseudomonas oryzihabitans TaxID=47885 RepID=UPI002895FA3F|nr:hypothetical protein [Pseudomonas oryzihabitans]MDT3722274.1 hypothetical protein [Pseudomonas oryzihabitans]